MKNTRKYLLAVCALAVGVSVPALRAEGDAPKKDGPPRMGNLVERILGLKEKLGLTEDQVAKIKKIAEETRAAMKALHDKEGDRESKRDDMRKIMEDAKAKIDAVLTAEQKAKLEELRKEHKGKGEGEGKGPKGPPPGEE